MDERRMALSRLLATEFSIPKFWAMADDARDFGSASELRNCRNALAGNRESHLAVISIEVFQESALW